MTVEFNGKRQKCLSAVDGVSIAGRDGQHHCRLAQVKNAFRQLMALAC